ncbi:DUF960 domain-containing protein [Streptococcus hongkongensis]|nr:hypothetical protein NC01_02475 [Streptococcus uberis]
MAFQNTKARYASFGIATNIPPEIIDSFWSVIDNNLKGVFKLDNILIFSIVNNKNKTAIEYNDRKKKIRIVIDTPFQFNPFLPKKIYVIDNKGTETILLAHEIH